jgi:hypothetical protein
MLSINIIVLKQRFSQEKDFFLFSKCDKIQVMIVMVIKWMV